MHDWDAWEMPRDILFMTADVVGGGWGGGTGQGMTEQEAGDLSQSRGRNSLLFNQSINKLCILTATWCSQY